MITRTLLAFAVAITASAPAMADEIPTEVGDCVITHIREVGPRLVGVPDSGDSVVYENGLYGISYSVVPGIRRSKAGDEVELCLTSVPSDCPPGDERGKMYLAVNQRNGAEWELPDAGHMCGGA